MDAFNSSGSTGFENQFRQMILNNTSQTAPEGLHPQSQPTVRLPPPPGQNLQTHIQQDYSQHHQGGHSQRGNYNRNVSHQGQYNQAQHQHQQQRMGYPPQQHGQSMHPNAGRGRGNFVPRGQHQYRQQLPLDPTAFRRGNNYGPGQRPLFDSRQHGSPQMMSPEQRIRQMQYMDFLIGKQVPAVEMSQSEHDEKQAFRALLQNVIFEVCDENPERLPRVSLECFGSFQSGFASANSDMDLVIVLQDEQLTPACSSLMEEDLPRALEKKLLQRGFGARLLTRTRVPIIKICEKPNENLLSMLREERDKWDALPEEKKYPHLYPEAEAAEAAAKEALLAEEAAKQAEQAKEKQSELEPRAGENSAPDAATDSTIENSEPSNDATEKTDDRTQKQRRDKAWTRERKSGPLDFPKDGIGIQCDINFFNPLGLHNTQLLRCYSMSDPRVRPMVLFVKAWAKQRKINSSYSGTLSSYGYVLMVLHYLINIAQPPVLSNLQLPWRPNPTCTPQGATRTEVDGWTVDFWRNEDEIVDALKNNQMSPNRDSLASLLNGFFYYYSSAGGSPQFHWMKDVLSLRVDGGLQTKEEKGWTKAVTEEGEGKKVQHRYLFCIEDPFELSHNVARTVTHNGIVAIRDEFRRAKRILQAVSNGLNPHDGGLFDDIPEEEDAPVATAPTPVPGNQDGPNLTPSSAPQQHPNGQHQTSMLPHKAVPRVVAGHQPNRSLDVTNNDAFPSLSSGGPNMTNKPKTGAKQNRNFPKRAQKGALHPSNGMHDQYAEKQAESTATGAAEAVLSGLD